MDRRVVVALQRFYPNGIAPGEIEAALRLVDSVTVALAAVLPAAPTAAPALPRRPRGRPPGAKGKHTAARARPSPVAVAAPEADPSNAARLRQVIQERGALTVAQLQEALSMEKTALYPLIARSGVVPVGEVELEDGSTLKTYGLAG